MKEFTRRGPDPQSGIGWVSTPLASSLSFHVRDGREPGTVLQETLNPQTDATDSCTDRALGSLVKSSRTGRTGTLKRRTHKTVDALVCRFFPVQRLNSNRTGEKTDYTLTHSYELSRLILSARTRFVKVTRRTGGGRGLVRGLGSRTMNRVGRGSHVGE